MSKIVVVDVDGVEHEFRDVLGQQVGYGSCQVKLGNGEQRIFNNFKEVKVLLTNKEKAVFKKQVKAAEENALARMRQQEEAEKQTEGAPLDS